jgi:hypothetical protein
MFDDQLVKLVPEVVGTGSATMAVIDSKEGAAGPVGGLLEFGLDDVQDDGDSILVVVSYDALMGVGSVRSHNAVPLTREFGRLIRLDKGYD